MNVQDFHDACDEARMFLKRATTLDLELLQTPGMPWRSANVAAVKRAGMDLTKALAKLRKGGEGYKPKNP